MSKKRTIHEFSVKIKRSAFAEAQYMCVRCQVPLYWSRYDLGTLGGTEPEFHHKLPIQDGGSREFENCEVLCQDCHSGNDSTFRANHPSTNAKSRVIHLQGVSRKRQAIIINQLKQKAGGS